LPRSAFTILLGVHLESRQNALSNYSLHLFEKLCLMTKAIG
jgi:hypothetical protein